MAHAQGNSHLAAATGERRLANAPRQRSIDQVAALQETLMRYFISLSRITTAGQSATNYSTHRGKPDWATRASGHRRWLNHAIDTSYIGRSSGDLISRATTYVPEARALPFWVAAYRFWRALQTLHRTAPLTDGGNDFHVAPRNVKSHMFVTSPLGQLNTIRFRLAALLSFGPSLASIATW